MSFSKLRIGMVSVDAPPHMGGMGRHVGCLVDGLRRAGHEVLLFDRSDRPLRVALGKNIGFSIGLKRALERWIRRYNIDLVHLHTGPGGALLRGKLSVPLIVTANHTYADQAMLPAEWGKRLFKGWERRTYQAADAVPCLTEDTARSVVDTYGIDRSKVSVIGCGFDLAPWIAADRETRDEYSAVFIGRPETRKGWDILCNAWKLLRHDIPEAVLHVVGFRDDQPGMYFHGRLADRELQSLVGRSQILVMPSRLEGFGLAAAEAIAAGTLVVGFDVLGLRNVVSPKTGILVQVSDIALADAIKEILFDHIRWKRLHDGCRDERSRFALASEIDAYLALYSRACTRS